MKNVIKIGLIIFCMGFFCCDSDKNTKIEKSNQIYPILEVLIDHYGKPLPLPPEPSISISQHDSLVNSKSYKKQMNQPLRIGITPFLIPHKGYKARGTSVYEKLKENLNGLNEIQEIDVAKLINTRHQLVRLDTAKIWNSNVRYRRQYIDSLNLDLTYQCSRIAFDKTREHAVLVFVKSYGLTDSRDFLVYLERNLDGNWRIIKDKIP